jgi:hypothetical protein
MEYGLNGWFIALSMYFNAYFSATLQKYNGWIIHETISCLFHLLMSGTVLLVTFGIPGKCERLRKFDESTKVKI